MLQGRAASRQASLDGRRRPPSARGAGGEEGGGSQPRALAPAQLAAEMETKESGNAPAHAPGAAAGAGEPGSNDPASPPSEVP